MSRSFQFLWIWATVCVGSHYVGVRLDLVAANVVPATTEVFFVAMKVVAATAVAKVVAAAARVMAVGIRDCCDCC